MNHDPLDIRWPLVWRTVAVCLTVLGFLITLVTF